MKSRPLEIEEKVEMLFELEEMCYKKGIFIGQGPKIFMEDCLKFFKLMVKRFNDIEYNEQNLKKKFAHELAALNADSDE